MSNHDITGLIVDFRTNFGGSMWDAYPGLQLLFDSTVETVGFGKRCSTYDHGQMCISFSPSDCAIQGYPGISFNRPIAVLIGPGAASSGEQIALAMAFHPRTKLFGKPTRSAFNSPETGYLDPGFYFLEEVLLDPHAGNYRWKRSRRLCRSQDERGDRHLPHHPFVTDG